MIRYLQLFTITDDSVAIGKYRIFKMEIPGEGLIDLMFTNCLGNVVMYFTKNSWEVDNLNFQGGELVIPYSGYGKMNK